MSNRVQQLIDAMDDGGLSTMYRRNSEVLKDYENNVVKMREIVNLMSIEMAKRGISIYESEQIRGRDDV